MSLSSLNNTLALSSRRISKRSSRLTYLPILCAPITKFKIQHCVVVPGSNYVWRADSRLLLVLKTAKRIAKNQQQLKLRDEIRLLSYHGPLAITRRPILLLSSPPSPLMSYACTAISLDFRIHVNMQKMNDFTLDE